MDWIVKLSGLPGITKTDLECKCKDNYTTTYRCFRFVKLANTVFGRNEILFEDKSLWKKVNKIHHFIRETTEKWVTFIVISCKLLSFLINSLRYNVINNGNKIYFYRAKDLKNSKALVSEQTNKHSAVYWLRCSHWFCRFIYRSSISN